MTTTTLPNTGAIVPVPQQRKGPAYASDLVTAFENYDEHDHTTGKGKPIGVAALNIDGDVDFKAIEGHHINNLGALNMRQVTNTILALSLYTDGEDLFWRDGSGDPIQLTLLHNVNESASGSITGLGAGSSGVSYTPGSLFYTFLDQEGDEAKIKQGVPSIFKKNDSMASREMILDFVAEDADGASFTKTFNPVSAEVVDQGTKELDFTHSTSPGSVTSGHSKIFFDLDNLPKFQNSSGTVTAFGAGGGAENAKTANFATGGDLDTITTNSFFANGTGTFSVETTAPIRGNESAHYEGYINTDTLTYETTIPIPRGYRNSSVRISFKYTGAGNIRLQVLDFTNDVVVGTIDDGLLVIPQSDQDSAVNPVYNDFIADVFIPNNVEQIRLRWLATGSNPQTSGDTPVDIPFIFDDIVVTPVGEATLPVTEYTYPTATVDNTNEFSARIDNTGDVGAATVISENVSFIKSATKTGTGLITIVFNDDMFSAMPSVQCVAVPPDGTEDDINSDNTQITEITATGFKIGYLHQGGGAGGEAHVFRNQGQIDISVSRQGVDIKTPILDKQTAGTVTSYEQSINQVPENSFSARFTGTTSPTIVSQNVTFVESVAHVSTGRYEVTFVTDFFSEIPAVSGAGEDNQRGFSVVVGSLGTTGFQYDLEVGGSGADSPAAIFVERQGDDYKEPTLLPTGAYILTPVFPLGSIVDSVLTETQYNQNTQGSWALCDGRSISGSALAAITSNNFAPNFSGLYAGMTGITGGAEIQVDTYDNFTNGEIITIGNVVLTASSTTNSGSTFQFVTNNDTTATNIAQAYNAAKEAQFSTATVSTNTVTIPSAISTLSTDSTSAISFPNSSFKALNATLASEVKASDVALTDPGHTHTGTQGVNGGVSGSFNGYQSITSRGAGGTYDTGSGTTGITISAGSETRPATYVVNKFIKIGD